MISRATWFPKDGLLQRSLIKSIRESVRPIFGSYKPAVCAGSKSADCKPQPAFGSALLCEGHCANLFPYLRGFSSDIWLIILTCILTLFAAVCDVDVRILLIGVVAIFRPIIVVIVIGRGEIGGVDY